MLQRIELPDQPHAMTVDAVIAALHTSPQGLSQQEAISRLEQFGLNALPEVALPGVLSIFFRQFLNPLIYILIVAAILSLGVEKYADAIFIAVVLVLNAVIGTVQEYSAQRSAVALHRLVSLLAHVQRGGEAYELNAENLVPGDLVLLESGDKVPADIRLINAQDLQIDESLLTGESLPVFKEAECLIASDAPMGDRINMSYSGTLVSRGRGMGIVIGTGLTTQVGQIAEAVLTRERVKPPLLLRMEGFTFRIAIIMSLVVAIIGIITFMRGMPITEVMLVAVALAVAAIPEGLPVAMTVALSISMRRMAKRHVIVRKLVTVEALGSCTLIASDKTGTLTVNELTVRKIIFPGEATLNVSGEGMIPEGEVSNAQGQAPQLEKALLSRLGQAVVLTNEGFLGRRNGSWTHHGDAVDVALLVMAHKIGITRLEAMQQFPEQARIPFESHKRFSASLHGAGDQQIAFVKGAFEGLLPMCSCMATVAGDQTMDATVVETAAHELASQGYRVLAIVSGQLQLQSGEVFSEEHLHGLTLLALIGMIDPLRKGAATAVAACHDAGLDVVMITGDHPLTALAIAQQLGLAQDITQVVTGHAVKEAEQQGSQALDALTQRGDVFARVEPQQKLDIVQSLQRAGHFVAVTGDGANDAPALHAAHVGVAMGKSGTDVAREAADMIITDDNFSSIVAGVEEGRIAYANVRKVIFLLISTGAAEIVLFILSLLSGLPLPLTAVQLLWLNLVTNGIQDVALAFEPGEGNELKRPPRPPGEAIFNRLMIQRVSVTAVVMGTVGFFAFQWMLSQGYSVDESRNGLLLLMVLFENIHVFNSRSETRSALTHNPLRNPILLFGTVIAQLLHIGAMYTPGLGDVLGVQPISFSNWFLLLQLALIVMLASEVQKFYLSRK